jgi:hypothetical protein
LRSGAMADPFDQLWEAAQALPDDLDIGEIQDVR